MQLTDLPVWVDTNCDHCRTPIKKRRSRYRRNTNNFCSYECSLAWRHERDSKNDDRLVRERFYQRVVMSDDESCWLWVGRYVGWGYGVMPSRSNEKPKRAHRASYEIHNGPIPEGLMVCHTCDNRWCVNPYHLFLGTAQDNVDDMRQKDRHNRGSRHGHAVLTEEDIPIIRQMHRAGSTYPQIAERFGVNRNTIQSVIRGKSWRHVADGH